MDGNNRSGGGQVPMGQPSGGAIEQSTISNSGGAAQLIDPDDWRSQLSMDSRHRIVNKIIETLQKHLPFSGQDGLLEVKEIAVRFEEKIYSTATNQSDYLRKISLKMLTVETKYHTPTANSLQTNAANASRNSSDLASNSMQTQIPNQALAMPIVGGQSQGRPQLLSQNMQNNISAAGVQNSASLTSTLPAVSNLTLGSIANSVGLSSALQTSQQMLEQQPQPVLRQHHQKHTQQVLHQQQTSMSQQPFLQAQQQPLQSSTGGGILQNQLIGQQNNIQDLQQQQQHRLMGQQNNIANLQQNNFTNMHQSQPGGGVSGHQQSAVLGMQSIFGSGMPSNQQSVHMLQQMLQNVSLLQNQTQQSQGQPSQHQMVSQIQQQLGQMQHLQQHSSSLQRDMQQRVPTSGALLQQQNNFEHQKQFFQSQRAMRPMPEASSNSLDSTAQTGNIGAGEWQEELYQKIKSLKDMYYPEMNDMYMKIAAKLQQHESLPQQPKSDQFEKLKIFKMMLEPFLHFVQMNKNDIQLHHKEKFSSIEKKITSILHSNKPRKIASLQPGQLSQPHMTGMQNSQLQSQISDVQNSEGQSQISHMQTHVNQMNPHMQPMNVQISAATMTQNNQKPVNLVGSLSSQTGVNTLQSNSSMLQNQHLKQQEQQHQVNLQMSAQLQQQPQNQAHLNFLQQQQLQHLISQQNMLLRQIQHQLLFSQQQHQVNLQMSAQLPGHTIDICDLSVKLGAFKHHSLLQQAPYAPLAPSPMHGKWKKVNSSISSLLNTTGIGYLQAPNAAGSAQPLAIDIPGISASSPLLAEYTSLDGVHGNSSTVISGRSIERLIKAVSVVVFLFSFFFFLHAWR